MHLTDLTMAKRVQIELGDRSYPIHIGAGLLAQTELLTSALAGQQVLVVTNDAVAPLYLKPVLDALDTLDTHSLILPDGEQHKDLGHWSAILDSLIGMGAQRDVTLVALGGGVVGDITGFAAASYMRGVDFVQIPTTLLAQVDAAVGGKTAVNHAKGKNLIGAFHQPCSVIIDTNTLSTLPEREFKAGLAEVIKYGLIGNADFFEWLLTNRAALLNHDADALIHAIEQSCREKAAVVAADEREGGVRALLNLGHTFGHAIETASGYGELLHGEAVAIGTCLAADLSATLGQISVADANRIIQTMASFELPVQVPATLDASDLIQLMTLDKKNRAGQVRLILLEAIGRARVQIAPDDHVLRDVIERRSTDHTKE